MRARAVEPLAAVPVCVKVPRILVVPAERVSVVPVTPATVVPAAMPVPVTVCELATLLPESSVTEVAPTVPAEPVRVKVPPR